MHGCNRLNPGDIGTLGMILDESECWDFWMMQPFRKTPTYTRMQDRIHTNWGRPIMKSNPPPGMARLLKPTLRGTEFGVLMGGHVGLGRCSRISSTTHMEMIGRLTVYKNGRLISYLILKYYEVLNSASLPLLVASKQRQTSVSCTELYLTSECMFLIVQIFFDDACSGFLALAFEVAPGSSYATFKGLWFCYLCYRVGLAVLTKDVWSLGHLLLCHL